MIGPFTIIIFQKWILQLQILIIHIKIYMFDVDNIVCLDYYVGYFYEKLIIRF